MSSADVRYNHKEAFALMWYACRCGHRECIWNSRDGVTPFSMPCPSCHGTNLQHVDWHADVCAPDHKLRSGQKFWRDGTPDEAEAIMRRRIDQSRGGKWEPTPEVATAIIKSAREGGNDSEFRRGWPTLDVAVADQS